MSISSRTFAAVASLCLLSVSPLAAQTAADPSGHWEGAIQAPGMKIGFAVDLAKNDRGQVAGTVSIPSQNIKGLPLLKIAVDGDSITFAARADQPVNGVFSADRTSISGDYVVQGHSIPFSITRTGDATIEAPMRSAPIGKELEGTWRGALDAQGKQLRLELTMANQADGMAIARIVALDEGGLEIPVVITQKDSTVAFESTAVASSFSGTLNTAGTELAGTFTEGPLVLPLTFRRASATDKR